MTQTILLSANSEKSDNLTYFQQNQLKPSIKGNVIETKHIPTNIWINEIIPLHGVFEWSFLIQRYQNICCLVIGIGRVGNFKYNSKQENNIQFFVGSGGKKFRQDLNGNTIWDLIGQQQPLLKVPFIITFKIDRTSGLLHLRYNLKEYAIVPLTKRMRTSLLQPRIDILEKGAQILLNPRHCAVCCLIKQDLSLCGKCKKVRYCGIDCQKKNWSEHKLVCGV